MKLNLVLSSVIVTLLISCKTTMLPEGELVNIPYTVVEQDGKSVWLIYRDSTGNDFNEAGIHKIKYSSYRSFRKRRMILEFFDINDHYLNTTSSLGFSKMMEVWKNSRLIQQSYFDSSNHLIKPSYLDYAKIIQKYDQDGSWHVSYFGCHNEPVCVGGVTQQHLKWDTIGSMNEMDTSYYLSTKILSSKKCKTE